MEYKIRRASADNWEPAMELCWRTFLKFEAPVYEKEGTENFLRFISGDQLYRMFLDGDYLIWIAESEGRILGTASLRSGNHISLLFVDEHYQRLGIGRALIKSMQEYTEQKTGRVILTVNSSPYGEAFYHKIGFVDTDERQKADGIIYLPMMLPVRL